ncbi:MAG: DUF1549 domain-containing protein [Planctomycetaceae bacterium]
MSRDNGHSEELATLLEKWCEERLSAQEIARLEHLVLTDRDAMRRYLAYVQLHGTLYWDTAIAGEAAGAQETLRFQADRSTPAKRTHQPSLARSQRWLPVTVCASLLLLAVGGFWAVGPLNHSREPVVARSFDSEPAEQATGPATQDDPLDRPRPIVRLDPRPAEAEPIPLPSEPLAPEPLPPAPPANAPDSSAGDLVAFIDAQLASEWEANGVTPSPPAEDAEWLRRAFLDLTGQIPPLPVLEEFEQARRSNKRANLVDQILAGDEFAQHFTTVWANQLVGRSARTAHERHGLQQFLLGQFRRNRPWNETVTELIAAEGSVRENGAAGFLMAHLNNQAVPATAITARLFLGQQVQCTQCHKHPWNEWSQEQFWNLNAFFQQTRIKRRTLSGLVSGKTQREPVLVNEPIGGPTYFENRRGVMQVTFPVFGGESIDPGPETNRRRELAALLSAGSDAQLARAFVNRTWGRFFGYGFTNPVDDMGPHNPPSHPELLERLARGFINSGYNVEELVRWITSTRAYHLSSRFGEGNAIDDPASGDPPLFSRMPTRTFSPGQVFDSLQVAASGKTRGEFDFIERRNEREAWVQQFIDVQENEENSEVSTFGDSLTQALVMMNGPLLSTAVRGEPDSVLGRILSARIDDEERIRQLCQAALARNPSPAELSRFRRLLGQAKAAHPDDPRAAVNEVLRDIYWAYLNSSEFVTIR